MNRVAQAQILFLSAVFPLVAAAGDTVKIKVGEQTRIQSMQVSCLTDAGDDVQLSYDFPGDAEKPDYSGAFTKNGQDSQIQAEGRLADCQFEDAPARRFTDLALFKPKDKDKKNVDFEAKCSGQADGIKSRVIRIWVTVTEEGAALASPISTKNDSLWDWAIAAGDWLPNSNFGEGDCHIRDLQLHVEDIAIEAELSTQ